MKRILFLIVCFVSSTLVNAQKANDDDTKYVYAYSTDFKKKDEKQNLEV